MSLDKFVYLLLDNAVKYFFISLPFFLVFYVFFRKKLSYKKIQEKFPKLKDYGRELGYSTLSVIIFSVPPLLMLYSDTIRPHTTFYTHIDEHGMVYFILAFPLMLLMHDSYFYWAHRIMHHPWLFKMVHLVHHKSTNPSPWAAYAFHPLEAVVESMIFVIFLFTIPVHSIHLMWFFVISLVYNVYGHLGFEIYPKGFNKHWFGKWMNTSVSHNQHHQFFTGNYGLYFTIWDRLMGTLRPDYDTAFENLEKRKNPASKKVQNIKKGIASFILIASLISFEAHSQNKADDITGIWLTGGKEPAKIQVYKSGEKFYGKIIWLKNPTDNGKQRVDANNPDKAKRNNPIIGLLLLTGFKFDGDDEWKGGDIYDPESGKTYSSYMYLKDKNTIKVRGYVGISLFGRTETWTRTN